MASRKKAFVLLRGTLSGMLIVGSREWYKREKVNRGALWKQLHQSDDFNALTKMAELGNKRFETNEG